MADPRYPDVTDMMLAAISKRGRKQPTWHRAGVRHSYPYGVNTRCLGLRGELRIDETMTYYDLENVLFHALGSESMARRTVSSWRRGLRGDALGRLLAKPALGIIEPKEIIKIKWTAGHTSFVGRSRIAATARACDAILWLVADERKTASKRGKPIIHQFMSKRRVAPRPPELFEESYRIFKGINKRHKRLPDSLCAIHDTYFDTWHVTDRERQERADEEKAATAAALCQDDDDDDDDES